MIELHQASYNPQELGWAVIQSIRTLLEDGGHWDTTLDTTYELDGDIFADQETTVDLHLIEDKWRGIANRHGIFVMDDGEAGWTYVGTIAEIDAMLNED